MCDLLEFSRPLTAIHLGASDTRINAIREPFPILFIIKNFINWRNNKNQRKITVHHEKFFFIF